MVLLSIILGNILSTPNTLINKIRVSYESSFAKSAIKGNDFTPACPQNCHFVKNLLCVLVVCQKMPLEQTVKMPVIWDASAFMWRHYNEGEWYTRPCGSISGLSYHGWYCAMYGPDKLRSTKIFSDSHLCQPCQLLVRTDIYLIPLFTESKLYVTILFLLSLDFFLSYLAK